MFRPEVLNFTGKHRCYSRIRKPLIGSIVSASGRYMNLDDETDISIDEALPEVVLARKKYDTSVFGVIGGIDNKGRYHIGNMVFNKILKSPRLVIQSHGEGAILVCNMNGNLRNGDYITTSSIPGYGMLQKSRHRYSHTVAKITTDCIFNDIDSDKTWKNKVYQTRLVGCLYCV
jgi:hypothetical protein